MVPLIGVGLAKPPCRNLYSAPVALDQSPDPLVLFGVEKAFKMSRIG